MSTDRSRTTSLKSNSALPNTDSNRARPCSPVLLTPTPTLWRLQCRAPLSASSHSSPAHQSAETPTISANATAATTTSMVTITNSSISEALSTSAASIKDTKLIESTRARIGHKKKTKKIRLYILAWIVTSKSSDS